MTIRITCIKKASGDHENPYVAISYLGWTNPENTKSGKHSRKDIYDCVDKGGYAYVEDATGMKARLITAKSLKGTEYVKTVADETQTDNLFSLKECNIS